MADFSWSEDDAIRDLNDRVKSNPDDYESWEKLVNAAETQEGGLNRNSNPDAIAAAREVYDNFLMRFPLFYAFWKRYADLEFSIAGSEAAESVYERGVGSCPQSVDMWYNYCKFKGDTCHDADAITELYERGAETIGLDFNAHPFWEAYIEHESGVEHKDRRFAILTKLVKIPSFQYARYFELYRIAAQDQPVEVLMDGDSDAERLSALTLQELGSRAEPSFSQILRKKFDDHILNNYKQIQSEVSDRWTYEQNIQRPYFHVTELEASELENWRKYLSYEESRGDYARIKCLYERCVMATASHEEFWFRYVRWLLSQEDKSEEIRNVYQRASFVFIRITEPSIRLAWSAFEESEGRVAVSVEIHEAVLLLLPNDIQTHISLAHLNRRAYGLEAARQSLQAAIKDQTLLPDTRGALVAEWAQLELSSDGDYSAAGQLFSNHWSQLNDSQVFWAAWLDFEADRDKGASPTAELVSNVKRVHDLAQTTAAVSVDALKQLAAHYMAFLYRRGGADAAKEAVYLDAFMNGPASIRHKEKYQGLFRSQAGTNGARARLVAIEAAE